MQQQPWWILRGLLRAEVRALSPAEAQHLLLALQGNPLQPLITLALSTGMRPGRAPRPSVGGRLISRMGSYRSAGKCSGSGVNSSVSDKDRQESKNNRAPRDRNSTPLSAGRVRQLENRLIAGSRWKETGLSIRFQHWARHSTHQNVTHRFQTALAKEARTT